jgi:hypothetical protein
VLVVTPSKAIIEFVNEVTFPPTLAVIKALKLKLL